MAKNTMQKKETSQPATAQPEIMQSVYYTPRVDILETPDELLLYADLPGVKPDDVDIRFENGELVIHGRCTPQQPQVDLLHAEYGVGDYYRAFTISEAIDANKIAAEMKNGVLTLHLPKTEAVKPRKIKVTGG